MSLSKKRIIIIGGTSGIGLATAKLAAKNGASLVIIYKGRSKID